MNARPILSTFCRACGQQNTRRSPHFTPRRPRSSLYQSTHFARLPSRQLTTTSHPEIQPVNDLPPTSDPLPPSLPPSSNPSFASIEQTPTESPRAKERRFTAKITSIHNLTAHATFTKQYWDPFFRKFYTKQEHVLVHDPFPARYLVKPSAEQITASRPDTAATARGRKDAAAKETARKAEATEAAAQASGSATNAGSLTTNLAPTTPSEVGRALTPVSLLRVGDVISLSTLPQASPSQSAQTQSRKSFFNGLELQRLLKTAGKHKKKVVQEHAKSILKRAKTTRSSKGVRFVVQDILTPFGETLTQRVEMARQGLWQAQADGSLEGGRMGWWRRKEQRGGEIAKVRR